MPTIDLGKIKPIYKGAYSAITAYELLDFVTFNGALYITKQSTTGNLPTDPAYWDVVSDPVLVDEAIHSASAKGSVVDSDEFGIADSEGSWALKKLNWATVKTAILGLVGASSQISYTAAGVGAVPTTVQNKLREVISVKDFGAVGDGVIDDTAAVQLAATAASGKVLFFPPGTYKIVDGFAVAGDNSVVLGHSATLVYHPTSASYYHCLRLFGNNCRVDGLRIISPDGLVRDDTGFGISVGAAATATRDVIITNCIIERVASAAIWVTNVERINVSNCIINDCLADGIHFADGCYDIVVDSNILENNGDDHIAVVNDLVGAPYVGRFVISNNIIREGSSTSGHGVAVIGALAGTISGNNISNTVAAGIGTYYWTDTELADSLVITGNKITNCGVGDSTFGGCGISLRHSGAVTINSNYISGLAYDAAKVCGGINVTNCTSLVVSGNTLLNNTCDHVVITGASVSATVAGNTFGDTARQGVLVSGSVGAAAVTGNAFSGTAGTHDVVVNLPAAAVKVTNNTFSKPISVTANNVNHTSTSDRVNFTSAVTAQAGTIALASATVSYQRLGDMVLVDAQVNITANGTGAGAVVISLPFSGAGGNLAGRENALTGYALHAVVSGNQLFIRTYNNGYPGGDGVSISVSGIVRLV